MMKGEGGVRSDEGGREGGGVMEGGGEWYLPLL